jgi:hypothetical protein
MSLLDKFVLANGAIRPARTALTSTGTNSVESVSCEKAESEAAKPMLKRILFILK